MSPVISCEVTSGHDLVIEEENCWKLELKKISCNHLFFI